MKKKYLDASNWTWLETYDYKYEHIEDLYSGYISYIDVKKVKHPLTVDYGELNVCLCDDGYQGIIFLPNDEKWCASAVYNAEGEIVEWYFDMTKEHGVDEKGVPYFMDLYLDVAVTPDFKARILDEDELEEALTQGIITEEDYLMAHKTCKELIEDVLPNKDFLVDFFRRYLEKYQTNKDA